MFPGLNMPERTAAQRKAKREAFGAWVSAESERARRQRLYLTVLKGTLRDGLVRSMLSRAWELLEANETEACDALLEFVPAEDAEAMFAEFFREIGGLRLPRRGNGCDASAT